MPTWRLTLAGGTRQIAVAKTADIVACMKKLNAPRPYTPSVCAVFAKGVEDVETLGADIAKMTTLGLGDLFFLPAQATSL